MPRLLPSVCSHVWSHISHLSLLGGYNLPEAFSRNPADSVIWNAPWLFIIKFTHQWEDPQKNCKDKNDFLDGFFNSVFCFFARCWDCCSSTLLKKLAYYHLNTLGYNEMACGMSRSVWKDKHKTPVYFHTVERLQAIIFQILSNPRDVCFPSKYTHLLYSMCCLSPTAVWLHP